MDKVKQWIALTVVGVLAVLVAGWFLLVAPKHSQAAALRAQADAQDLANSGLRTSLALLKAQAKDEPAQEATLAAVAAKIPDNPALPALIRDLDKATASTGVDLQSLAPGPPTLVAAPADSTQPPTALSRTAGVPTVARGVAAAGGSLAAIPITLNITGSYFQALEFVDQLETLNRAFKVTTLSLVPGGLSLGSANAAPSPSTPSLHNPLTVTISGVVYLTTARVQLAPVTSPAMGK